MLEHLNRERDMIRSALGPFEELRRSGALDKLALAGADISRACGVVAEYTARFRLPDIREATRLFQELEISGASTAMRRIQEQGREIQSAMERMRAPWLDTMNRIQSIGGFAELQSIGIALRNLPAFDDMLAERLRAGLGDWREAINWSEKIFTDALERSAFYAGRGFDTRLTDFPADAFREGAGIAGLVGVPPPLIGAYEGEGDEGGDDEEDGFERTNAAHDRLMRFETQLRKFIDEAMTAAFGENWIKQRVPGEIWTKWRDKREQARDRGEQPWPLIAYADFSDYVPIITRRDNWEGVFKPIFCRVESVIELFQRLYPIRICTMHARVITQDDELYLYVEVKRLLAAIGIEA